MLTANEIIALNNLSKMVPALAPDQTKGAALQLGDELSELQAGVTQRVSLTVGHADLTDADTSQTVNFPDLLPANARIVGVDMHTYTPFTGGTVSAMALDIGDANDVDAIVDGANVLAAAVDGGPSTMPAGIRPTKLFATAGGQLQATFVSTTDNLVNLTAGAITIDVLYVVLA